MIKLLQILCAYFTVLSHQLVTMAVCGTQLPDNSHRALLGPFNWKPRENARHAQEGALHVMKGVPVPEIVLVVKYYVFYHSSVAKRSLYIISNFWLVVGLLIAQS